ncbi:MAG: excinuclease ABC subunit UvrC [Bacteriovoracaceae bacterium]|nr:excinuclease ABC subunit UvrC [Bacteriovoracaceae bacterium]
MKKDNIDLLKQAHTLPQKPGCYLMKDARGAVIYVGKAKSLKVRVICYFNDSKKDLKTTMLVKNICDFEFIMTSTEVEAFVLENNLIKKHSPKYNIRLKDDKTYPYVIIDFTESFPQLRYVRRFKRGPKKKIFGPFTMGSNISNIIKILTKTFLLRDCSLRDFKTRKRACLRHQMKQCCAPCIQLISKQDYEQNLSLAINFFTGKGAKSLQVLQDRMAEYAQNEEFEKALILRDQIGLLEDFLKVGKQVNAELFGNDLDIDIISYYDGESEVDISIYMMRAGILLGHKNFHFRHADYFESLDREILNQLFQYYENLEDPLPKLVITPFSDDNIQLLQNAKLQLKVASPGKKYKALITLVAEHAKEQQRVRLTNQNETKLGLHKLQELLGLKRAPLHLECFDVAIWQGKSPTASQVVFRDGRPDKKSYRYYHLQECLEGNNDFAMMKELISRRIKHGSLPDVFIVDGGKGQVSSFLTILEQFNIRLPVVGIIKSKAQSPEKLVIPKRLNPYLLAKDRYLYKIMAQMRDEAHRFARKLHHLDMKNSITDSWLDNIHGIGPITKQKVLERLDKGIEELKVMDVDSLQDYLGVSKLIAGRIRDYLV